MKRVFTFLVLSAFYVSAHAQVIFSQDFESGALDPMTAVDVDGKVVNPNVANIAGPTFQVVQQSDGNHVVVSTSWFEPVGQADDWIISPPIIVTSANTFLSWRAYSPDASYRDGYQVRVSTTDNQIASFSNLALNVAAELTTWTKRSVKLGTYVGDTIYFAFRNNSNDKFLLYMDDFNVEILKNENAIVRSLTFEKYNAVGTEVPVKITVENHGANPLTGFIFDYTIGGETFTDTVTGLNVAPLRTTDVTHTISYPVSLEGEFPIDVEITEPNGVADEDSTDNEISRVIYGLQTAVAKKVLVEEATGTWCQWCPRGAVNMDIIAATYPDKVMPVAVHNFDPMVVEEYDTPFSGSVGGYPSGHVDRKIKDIDPLDFIASFVELQDRLVPVAVNTTTSWDAENRIVTISGKASTSINTQNNALRFMAIVTENDVQHDEPGYEQYNAYAGGAAGEMGGYEELPNPVPADQMIYHFVARALFGTFDGLENSVPDATTANEEFDFEFTYTVPAEYNEANMKAIVVVLDEETGEVLNGDIAEFLSVSTPVIPAGRFVAYPNPTTDILNLEVDYKTDATVTMRVYTTLGQLVRDLGTLDLSNGTQSTQINVADFANGNYILELRNDNKVTALPFTKM